MSRRIVVIIQARLSSTRLPNKVLYHIGHQTVLEHVIERCKDIKGVDDVVVATCGGCSQILDICENVNCKYYIGDELNVLKRYYDCAKENKADTIIRVTSDCPFIDPVVISSGLDFYLENNYDIVSNTKPRSHPHGCDYEIFSFEALSKAARSASSKYYKEHVGQYMYDNLNWFNYIENNKIRASHIRMTLDYEEDLDFLRGLYQYFNNTKDYSYKTILDIIEKNPELLKLNESKNAIRYTPRLQF